MPFHGPFPRYHFPARLQFEIIISMLLGKTRNFQDDAQVVLSSNETIKFSGRSFIPIRESFLLTLNHYSRPGFLIIWAAIAIAACLPQSSIWVMTRTWTNRGGGLDAIRTWLTSCLLLRLADIYGFVTMPPMPPVPEEQTERAIGIRKLMQAIRDHPEAALCLAPQGQDFPDGVLGAPPPGTGKLIILLSRHFEKILPVGVYEQDYRLVVNFGKPYRISEWVANEDPDERISWCVMRQIALCMPDGLNKLYSYSEKE